MRRPSTKPQLPARRAKPECDGRYFGLVAKRNGLFYAILVFRPSHSKTGTTVPDEVVPGTTCVRPTVEAAKSDAVKKARAYNRWMREHGARRELEQARREAMFSAPDTPVLEGRMPKRQHWPAAPVAL